MGKRSNQAQQDQQGSRRTSKRIKKSTYKAEALRKSEVRDVAEDDEKEQMTIILVNGIQKSTASDTNKNM